jgi:hypothetical protein
MSLLQEQKSVLLFMGLAVKSDIQGKTDLAGKGEKYSTPLFSKLWGWAKRF